MRRSRQARPLPNRGRLQRQQGRDGPRGDGSLEFLCAASGISVLYRAVAITRARRSNKNGAVKLETFQFRSVSNDTRTPGKDRSARGWRRRLAWPATAVWPTRAGTTSPASFCAALNAALLGVSDELHVDDR